MNYDKVIKFWDDVFSKEFPKNLKNLKNLQTDLKKAIEWLAKNSDSVIDFGCGSGVLLLACYDCGITKLSGIDISKKAIELAQGSMKENGIDSATLKCGGIETLQCFPDHSFDSGILSNIVDNLSKEDALEVLKQFKRILKPNAKLLLKVNPFLTKEKIEEWNIKVIKDDFLDDGLFLLNLSTEKWTELFNQYFDVVECKDIYFEKFDQTNRLFLLTNKG